MNACPTCPNRLHADTLEALSEAAASSRWFRIFAPVLKQRAEEIRAVGCNNWKLLREDLKDPNTGHVVETREVARCMRDRMVSYLNDIHMHAALTGQAAESHRNVVAEGFSYLAGRPIRGDGKALPDGWQDVIGIGKAPAAIGDGNDPRSDG